MPKPIIFLAFANDKQDNARYLRNLSVERKGILEVLQPLEKENVIEIVNISDTTLADLANVFQDSCYRDRIVGFHYGGHADGYQLLLETTLTVVKNPVSGLEDGTEKRLLPLQVFPPASNTIATANREKLRPCKLANILRYCIK